MPISNWINEGADEKGVYEFHLSYHATCDGFDLKDKDLGRGASVLVMRTVPDGVVGGYSEDGFHPQRSPREPTSVRLFAWRWHDGKTIVTDPHVSLQVSSTICWCPATHRNRNESLAEKWRAAASAAAVPTWRFLHSSW